jgi:hypothetical protein
MDGERSIHLRGRFVAILPPNLHRGMAAIVLGLLSAAGLMVVSRRLAGVLENPLEPTTLLATGILATSVAVAIRLGWFWPPVANPKQWLDGALMLVTSLAVAALGVGLSLPGTPMVGMFVLCTLLGAEEIGAWAWYIRRIGTMPLPVQRAVRLDAAHAVPARAGRGDTAPHAMSSLDPETAILPEEVTQQLTRSQAADGAEELSGWLRLAFAAGQRTGSIHVAFCPPFAAAPALEVEQIDGPETRIKTAQLLPYGARIDLKLTTAAEEPTSVVLQFSARTTEENRQ